MASSEGPLLHSLCLALQPQLKGLAALAPQPPMPPMQPPPSMQPKQPMQPIQFMVVPGAPVLNVVARALALFEFAPPLAWREDFCQVWGLGGDQCMMSFIQ